MDKWACESHNQQNNQTSRFKDTFHAQQLSMKFQVSIKTKMLIT